ncbi:MAG: acyloxyacyl hydrolase [Flammeovirgaceae bacterium]|nr:acyloxyacyl hydrolase [Flammeovirgaceae bacterium]
MNVLKPAGVILFYILCIQTSYAQNWFFNIADSADQKLFPKTSFLQVRYQLGTFVHSGEPGVRYIEENPFQSVDFRYGLIGYGRKKWQQVHHYPTYGLGISKFFFQPTDNILGNPFSTYIFFNESIFQFRKSRLSYDFDIGLSYGWKRYDPQTNPEQKVIGSSVNFIVMLGLQYELKLSNRWDGIVGINVDHMSNGRIRSPNDGVNLHGANLSLRYRLTPPKPKDYEGDPVSLYAPKNIQHVIDPFKPMYEFYAVGSGGVATTYKDMDDHIYYFTASLSVDVARHYNYNGKFGAGLDLFYDASLVEDYESQYPTGNVPSHLFYWPGVHISHEYMVHRWTLITQAGLNLKVPSSKGVWYGRVGLRYDLSKSIFLRASLRVYDRFYSDFIEWGVGYSFYKIKRR